MSTVGQILRLSGALLVSVLAPACMSPVVGAECREGLVECNGHCVDLSSDPAHCGACGEACPLGGACGAGLCASAHDAGVPVALDGGAADGGGGVVHHAWPPNPYPTAPIGPELTLPREVSCELGELACDGACVDPDRDPSHCGACGTLCTAAEVCAVGACAGSCAAPLSMCGALCVDTSEDADHCGGCGIRCETGICREGRCEAPLAGHVVIVGHDYTERRSAMSRVIGNAVLLPARRDVHVVAFEGASSEATRAGTDAAIDETAAAVGRAWGRAPTTEDRVSYELAQADALLVYAQPTLAHEAALAIGALWRTALGTFVAAGGTVVVLVGPGTGGGSLAILEGAGLLEGTPARTDITGDILSIERPADALAVGVPLSYRGEATTVRLDLPLEDAVVSDGLGPVVVHHVIVPEG